MLSPEQFADVFMRIEAGETVLKICAELNVPRSTFQRWVEGEQTLSEQYARALQFRADSWAEQVVATGCDVALSSDHRRISVDALKWAAGKAAPKKYGDHLELSGDITVRSKAAIDRAVKAARDADD